MKTLTCKKCGKSKPEIKFYYYHKSWCKKCVVVNNTEWRKNNPDVGRKASRRWRSKNRDKRLAYCKAYYQANKNKWKKYDAQKRQKNVLS